VIDIESGENEDDVLTCAKNTELQKEWLVMSHSTHIRLF